MRHAFVTGATGFIGSRLVASLIDKGVHCRCLVRSRSNVDHLRHDAIELVPGTLTEPDSYRNAIRNCDVVFHVAGMKFGRPFDELKSVNGRGCADLADGCRAVPTPPRLIYMSSLAAAGPPPAGKSVREETDSPQPISRYGESKRLGETLLEARAADMPITVLRPGIVFGPGDTAMAALYRSIYRFRLHLVVGFKHTPALSLIHVDDLIELTLRATESGEVLNGLRSSDHDSSGYYFAVDDAAHPDYRQLGHWIAQGLDRQIFVLPMAKRLGGWFGHAGGLISRLTGRPSLINRDKIREATVDSWACSGEKARRQLGFQVEKTLFDRLQETGKWYLRHGWI